MHKNYRRRDPQNPTRHRFFQPTNGQRQWYLRLYSKQRRQSERQAFAHEEWEDLPSKYPKCFLYNYW